MSDEYLSLSGTDPRGMRPNFLAGRAVTVAMSTLFRNVVPFLSMALVAYAPVFVLNLANMPEGTQTQPEVTPLGVVLIFVGLLALLFATQLTTAFVTVAVFRTLRGQKVSLADSLRTGFRKVPVAFGTAFCVGLLTMLGILVCVVPGIIVALMYAVAVPVAIVENKGIRDAMERSKQLTDGNRWMILGVFILAWVVTNVPILVGVAVLAHQPIALTIWQTTWTVVGNTFQAVLVCVIYFQLRESVENMDLADLAAVFD